MRKSVFVVLLVGLVVIAAAIYLSSAAKSANNTTTVRRGSVTAVVSATGRVSSEREARLGFKIGGRVDKVLVKAGDAVEQGQVLAELDPVSMQNAVLQAQASLDLADLKVAHAQAGAREEEIRAADANVQGAEAKLNEMKRRPTSQELIVAKVAMDKAAIAVQDSQTTFDKVSWREGTDPYQSARRNLQLATLDYEAAVARYEQLAEGPSAEELRIAESQVTVAKSQLDLTMKGVSPEEIAILQKQVELARFALDQAKNQRAEATLTSPLSGTVLSVQVNPGENVLPQQWAISVGDISALQTKANIDEVDVGKVAEGQEVTIVFDAFPGQKVEGKIRSIAPSATVQQGSNVYQTIVTFSAPGLQVRSGMAASLDVIAKRKDGVLLVPNRALQTVGKKKMVEVVDNGARTKVEVEAGLYNGRETEIISGLSEGQKVVISD